MVALGVLWSLARDPRWVVGPLLDVVRGEIWVRALRLLGDREPPASVAPRPWLLEFGQSEAPASFLAAAGRKASNAEPRAR
jgi:hypothetical protein